jgi:hypothetical protein
MTTDRNELFQRGEALESDSQALVLIIFSESGIVVDTTPIGRIHGYDYSLKHLTEYYQVVRRVPHRLA